MVVKWEWNGIQLFPSTRMEKFTLKDEYADIILVVATNRDSANNHSLWDKKSENPFKTNVSSIYDKIKDWILGIKAELNWYKRALKLVLCNSSSLC